MNSHSASKRQDCPLETFLFVGKRIVERIHALVTQGRKLLLWGLGRPRRVTVIVCGLEALCWEDLFFPPYIGYSDAFAWISCRGEIPDVC